VAKLVMIVEVFVPERDGEHALADEGRHAMLHELRPARSVKEGGEALNEPDRTSLAASWSPASWARRHNV
jgi:hypothetical protein